jgi:hypothetical protein
MHGGIGVTFEHDLHLFLRRVTVNRALAGTPAEHRQRIGAIMSGREAGGVSALSTRETAAPSSWRTSRLPERGPVVDPGQPASRSRP